MALSSQAQLATQFCFEQLMALLTILTDYLTQSKAIARPSVNILVVIIPWKFLTLFWLTLILKMKMLTLVKVTVVVTTTIPDYCSKAKGPLGLWLSYGKGTLGGFHEQ